jgi:hypothetical protein
VVAYCTSSSYVEKVPRYERACGTARAGIAVGMAGAAVGARGPSLAAFCVVTIDVAYSMKASSGPKVPGSDGAPLGRAAAGTMGPSSAAAGVAKPMAQNAMVTKTRSTKVLFLMESTVVGMARPK